jgi:hypothetical protein
MAFNTPERVTVDAFSLPGLLSWVETFPLKASFLVGMTQSLDDELSTIVVVCCTHISSISKSEPFGQFWKHFSSLVSSIPDIAGLTQYKSRRSWLARAVAGPVSLNPWKKAGVPYPK